MDCKLSFEQKTKSGYSVRQKGTVEWIAYKLKVKISYEKPVADEYFQLKCLPRTDETQKIAELTETILPQDCMVKKRINDAKNPYLLGYMAKPHTEFSYEAEGTVQIQKYNRKPEPREMLYRISSPYTEVGQNLGEWYGELNLPEGEVRDRALWIAGFVKRKLKKKDAAAKERLLTADQAAGRGYGSNRDFAQIMLALCHMDGITARYVTGILPGKTELHSWVEVQAEDGIFYGMDPEFGIPVTESYIAFCQGRDARECSLLVSRSAGEKEGEIQVSVEAAPSEKKEYALMPESGNIHWLARKMAVRNSSFQSIPLDRLNRVMGNLEFTILSILKDRSVLEGAENRLYVRDISQWLNVPAGRLSPIFTRLEEEGYIHWESDERVGASYVVLTDYGKKKMDEQQEITVRFYEHVIERFGREKARELDRLMLELESVLRDELSLMKDEKEGGEADE